jgi:glycosyltransferase involved in cell wall biosynthesis
VKIHFFVQFVHPVGTYFRFHNLAVGLIKLGHDVTVFGCSNDPGGRYLEEQRDGVRYKIWRGAKGQSIFGQWNHPLVILKRYFAEAESCDVAHLFQPFYSGAAPWIRLRRTRKAKLLAYDWDDLWENGLDASKPDNLVLRYWDQALRNNIERNFPKRADLVTCCSEFLRTYSLDRGAENVTKIYNGFWPYDALDKVESRRMLGLRPDALYAGFMGRTLTGVPFILDAFEKAMHGHPSLRLAFCGLPKDVLSHLPAEIQDRIDNLGDFTPFQTRYFSSAIDVGLLPLEDTLFNRSRFPIKFAEYMASGTPVIVSSVGECASIGEGMPWVLQAGTTGESWERAFLSWCEAEKSAINVGLQRIREKLDWAVIAKQLETTYQDSLTAVAR